MDSKFLTLNDISSYKTAFNLSNKVWDIVLKWDYFARDTVGNQFIRAVDSISANIAEGFGRYHKKDKVKFYRYSYASTLEALDWNQKAKVRKLINANEYDLIFKSLQELPKDIHTLIKFTNQKLKQ